MKSKRLLTELLDYIDLFEQSFPEEEELTLRSFLVFVQSIQEGEHALRASSAEASTPLLHARTPR